MPNITPEFLNTLATAGLDANFPTAIAKNIKMVVLDIDGVLTDGGLYYNDNGLAFKRFEVQDGMGIKMAQRSGIEIVIISGMKSAAVEARATDLGINECHTGCVFKLPKLEEIMQKNALEWKNVAYVGDDVIDLPIMCKAGLPLAVANAQPEVKAIAAYVTPINGGNGAVRQLLRHIMAAQGVLENRIADFFAPKS
ncbi:HAD-IIIA family hydrolase [Desulfovibrio sp. OttesenSCG-928-F07]|nr:HAD-IIIA family hydrolase [Desulfovibrio sp. OttesenSCG-928-F07]